MAKISDPDFLNQATEVVLNTGAKTIQLLVAGNLNDTAPGKTSGVTGKALYSFLKEEWKSDNALNRFKFPIQMIYEASFILINGWTFADQQTIDLIRDAGFQVQATGAEHACIISLGNMNNPAADLAYYQQIFGFDQTTTVFDKTGELNENIQIFDGSVTDYRDYLKVFLREQGKTFSQYNLLSEQGLPSLTYQAYRLPLANGLDLNILESDANIAINTPYTGILVNYLKGVGFTTYATATVYPASAVVYDAATGRWFFTPAGGTSSGANVASDVGVTDWESYEGERQIGTSWYAFNRIIEGNNATTTQIYEKSQYLLRQSATDINSNLNTLGDGAISAAQLGFGTVNGNVAAPLLEFVGSTLVTRGGVYIDNFNGDYINRIEFYDITVDGDKDADGNGLTVEFLPETTTKRIFPFVATGTLNFSANLDGEVDSDTRYTMYHLYITRTVSSGIAITGAAGSSATFDYSAATGILDHLSSTLGGLDDSSADYILVSGFTNSVNNGLWLITSDPSTNTFTATKQDGATVVNEVAGATVTVDENPFESPTAFIVDNTTPAPISGLVTGTSIPWNFDYDNNTQGGRIPANDAPVIIVAQGTWDAQWVAVNYTIGRSAGQAITITANDDLNYDNPV